MKIPSSNLVRTCCVQKLFMTFRAIFAHNMFSPCSAKRRASDKDLPVLNKEMLQFLSVKSVVYNQERFQIKSRLKWHAYGIWLLKIVRINGKNCPRAGDQKIHICKWMGFFCHFNFCQKRKTTTFGSFRSWEWFIYWANLSIIATCGRPHSSQIEMMTWIFLFFRYLPIQ